MNKRNLNGWSVLATFSLVLTLLVSACESQPTVEEIVANVREVEASTEDAHAILEVSLQAQGMDEEAVVEVWEKRPNKLRAEVLEASDPKFVGIVSVTDGQQGWMYNPTENEVIVGEADQDEPTSPREMLQFAENIIQRVLDTSEVELVDEEEVAGVATYKLAFTPKEDSEETVLPVGSKATLWVDQERWIVLQAHFVGDMVGEGWMRVRSFDLNAGVADERFHFEIPEGAEVVDLEDMQPDPITLNEALEQAEFSLLVPSYVPEGTTLIDVLAMDGGIVLRYDHAAVAFTVVQRLEGEEDRERLLGLEVLPQESVTVRGQTATLFADEDAGKSLLTWTEGGVDITIAGDIGRDEILKVAESLQ
jgi:outer membrane lipoprotein-sorting protein